MLRQIGGPDRERDFFGSIARDELTVVHFKAEMFAACPRVTELLTGMANDAAFEKALVLEIEAEEVEQICRKFGVETVPTVLYFCQSKVIDRVDGFKPAEITSKLNRYCSQILVQPGPVIPGTSHSHSPGLQPVEVMEERLKGLINQNKVMLFMKGSPDSPRCGFSRKVVQMLQEANVEFGYFDILQDEDVRQGLKTYSEWQTYPQIYANGELVGGHDIILELHQEGQLAKTLKGE